MIEKDENMPVTEDGEKAEIILNPLGVLNRLNIGQIIESHINLMSNRLVERLVDLDWDLYEMEDELFGYLKQMSPDQYNSLYDDYIMMNRGEREAFFEDIIENGIYVHQSPFFDNTDIPTFEKIFKDKPYLVEPYKFQGIEKPLVMGELYFIRLKHEASNKTSVRSTDLNNLKNLPSKSNLKKQKRSIISATPIRIGKQLHYCRCKILLIAGNSDH